MLNDKMVIKIQTLQLSDASSLQLMQQHEDMYCRRFPLVCANSCGHEGIPREEVRFLV